MADTRGRDLKVSILSDTSKFDLSDAADDLDDLAQSSDKATDELRRLAAQGQDAQRELDRLNSEVKDNGLERLGTDAKETARKVDAAFDDIARSARTSSRKVDDETHDMRDSLNDVKDEARDTAREMGASFSGGGDIADGLQEVAANAGRYLGPIGEAGGLVGAAFIGLFMAQMEELRQQASALFDDMIESNSTKLSKTVIDARINAAASEDPGAFGKEFEQVEKLIENYHLLGITVEDVIRAKYGDVEASSRVDDAIASNKRRLQGHVDELGNWVDGNETARAALDQLKGKVDESSGAYALATRAMDANRRSTDETKSSVDKVKEAFGKARAAMGDPIEAEVNVNAPTPYELAKIRLDMQRYYERNPVTIPVKPGQRPIRDVF